MPELRVRIGDWVLACQTDSSAIADLFSGVLGPAPSAGSSPPDIVIQANVADPPVTPAPSWRLRDESGQVSLWSTPDGQALTLSGASAVFDDESSSFRFVDLETAVDWMHTFCTAVINHAARVRDCVPAHAALVEVDDAWLLLLGSSGAGKSTACLAVARANGGVAADDSCLLRLADGVLAAHGLPRAPSLPLAAHGLGDDRAVDHRGRTNDSEFDLVDGWKPVAGVVLVRHGQQPLSVLEAVTAMEMIRASTSAVGGALETQLIVDSAPDVVRAMAARPAFGLAVGAAASERLTSMTACLAEAARRCREVSAPLGR